jgi:hypothetical protein
VKLAVYGREGLSRGGGGGLARRTLGAQKPKKILICDSMQQNEVRVERIKM